MLLIPGGQRWRPERERSGRRRRGRRTPRSSASIRPARLGRRAARRRARSRPARSDAPLGRARHGRGGDRPVPGHEAGHRSAIEDGFYYDFDVPRPLTTDDLAASSSACTESIAADHPFVRREMSPDDGAGVLRGQGPAATRSRSSTTCGERRAHRGTPTRRRQHLRARAVHRPVPRPARRIDRARSGRSSCWRWSGAYWRGDEKRPMLQRDLRHGLADAGGARPLPVAPRGGEEARPPAAGRPARPVLLPRRLAGRRVLAPQGLDALSDAARTPCASSRPSAATRRSTRHRLFSKTLWEQSGHWELYRENMFLVEAEEQTFSLKPMNCPESTYIYRSRVRSYRELPLRLAEYGVLHRNELSGVLSGLTRVRHFVTDDAHIYVRPDQIGSEIQALHGRGPRVVLVVRPRAAVDVRDAAGEGARRSGRCGPRPRRMMRDALERSGMQYRVKPKRRGVLRAQDRHPDRGCARARVADGDDPGRPRHAARALRPARTSTSTASSSGRWRSTARSTARSSASSAC